MKPRLTSSIISFILLITFIVPSIAMAANIEKAIVHDLTESQLMEMYGKAPSTGLTPKEIDEVAAFRYDGDTLKVLTILVDWNDRPSTLPSSIFENMMLSRGFYPNGSIPDYFDEVSYGMVYVTGDVFGWYNAGNYNSYYDFESLLYDLDMYIDYSDFDGNNDGYVDAVIFIRSGNGEEDSGDSNDIWSHAYSYHPDWAPGPFDGKLVTRWCTAPETMPLRDAANPHLFAGVDTVNCISVAAHELTHNFGLPDVYDYDDKLDTSTFSTPNDYNDHPFVDWCLMGYNGYGLLAIKKIIPPHLTGWCKKEMGWNDPILLDGDEYQDLVLYDIETSSDSSLYQIMIDSTKGEYFLLEYRNPHSAGMFDKLDSDFSVYLWPDLTFGGDTLDRGLQITHVYDSVNTWGYSNNGTPDYTHYRLIVEDAGYNPDRDAYSNPEGHVTDSAQWWYPFETRRAALFSDDVDGQQEFGPDTYPSSDGYFGPSNVYIRVDSIVDNRLYLYYANNSDSDDDGHLNYEDNCPDDYNPDQNDADNDLIGDVCDNCPDIYNPDQIDIDQNGTGDLCEIICGDANSDLIINILDISFLIAYLYDSGQPPESLWAADPNGDGNVNILDINYLIAYLYLTGPEPTCQ